MKTKKALGGLFGLFGSLAAFFDCFLPAPAPLRFNLNDTVTNEKTINDNNKTKRKKITNATRSNKSDLKKELKAKRITVSEKTTIPVIGDFSVGFGLRHGEITKRIDEDELRKRGDSVRIRVSESAKKTR